MERQTAMVESFLANHREFISNLEKSLVVLEKGVGEAAEWEHICTNEWCRATEDMLDELAKAIYSISEPRWVTSEDSLKLKGLRIRIHDLYARYKGITREV